MRVPGMKLFAPALLRSAGILVGLLGFCLSGADSSTPINEAQFTSQFAEYVSRNFEGYTVSIAGNLEIKAIDQEGNEIQVNLSNAYRSYVASGETPDNVIRQYAKNLVRLPSSDVDVGKLRPVIRDREYIENATALKGGSPDYMITVKYLTPDLGLFFAFDAVDSLRFVNNGERKKLGLNDEELLARAIENLDRGIEQPEIAVSGPIGIALGDSPYLTSLILSEKFWREQPVRFSGDPVVFLVSRELLVITGSEETEAVARLSELATEWIAEAAYPISVKPIVRKNGAWSEFTVSR